MLVEGQNPDPGSGADGAGSSTVTADPNQTPPSSDQATPDQGGADGAPPAPVDRPLEDLGGESGKLSEGESRTIRLAAKLGFTTQAQVDEYLAKKAGKAPATPPDPKVKGAPAVPPKADTKPNPLHDLVKAISPTLDPTKPETAVASIKELQRTYTEAAGKVKQLEAYYPQLEAGLIAQLDKGQEGVIEIYKRMGRPVPAGMFAGAPSAPAAAPAAAPAPGSFPELDGLRDDDFVPASSIKTYIPKLVAQLRAELRADFEKEYGPIKESHSKIMSEVEKDANRTEADNIRKGAMADAQFHSDFMGALNPEESLDATAEEIWKASVDENGRFKSDRHPEFPKLQKILQARKAEYLDSGHKAASYEHFLYEKLHKSGNMEKFMSARAEREKSKLLTKQQQRVQPMLAPKGAGAGGLASFVVPKTVEDVQKMSPEAIRELKQRIYKGEVKVALPT